MYGKERFINADGVAMVDKFLTVTALRDLLATLPADAILRPNDITRDLVIYADEDADIMGWIDFSDGTATVL